MMLFFLLPLKATDEAAVVKEVGCVHVKITSNTYIRPMLDSFLTFINQHELQLDQNPSLLTVSGGVDSVVMAHLFYKLGFPAGIAHCNFGLRGEESEQDERFVEGLALDYNFPFFATQFETKEFAKKRRISTQMAARELRYSWFEKLRNSHNFRWIATAHHANDSLETLLLNLIRGTGLHGLRGISVKQNSLIRPLLFATKEEILDYAKTNNLKWRDDSSNDSEDYKRNLLRHRVTPIFKQLNPSLEYTFNQTSKRINAASNLLDEYLQNWKTSVFASKQGKNLISIERLLAADEPVYRLWYLLEDFGFSYHQCEQIISGLPGISGRRFLSDSHILLIDRSDLIIRDRSDKSMMSVLEISKPTGCFQFGDLALHFLPVDRHNSPRKITGKDSIIVASEKLIFPLSVRMWAAGDTFQPFGMQGKRKKLSDLFIDLKMDLFQKENTYVLLNGNGETIWVIGIRSDERYRVEEPVENAIFISISDKI